SMCGPPSRVENGYSPSPCPTGRSPETGPSLWGAGTMLHCRGPKRRPSSSARRAGHFSCHRGRPFLLPGSALRDRRRPLLLGVVAYEHAVAVEGQVGQVLLRHPPQLRVLADAKQPGFGPPPGWREEALAPVVEGAEAPVEQPVVFTSRATFTSCAAHCRERHARSKRSGFAPPGTGFAPPSRSPDSLRSSPGS